MTAELQPYSEDRLPELIELIAANAQSRWPAMTPLLPGDLAWQLPGSAPEDNLRLYYGGERLLGYAWFQPPCTLMFDLADDAPYRANALRTMLHWAQSRQQQFDSGYPFYLSLQSMAEWAEAIRGLPQRKTDSSRYLVTSVLGRDQASLSVLQAEGFTLTDHFSPHLTRSLEDLATPPNPAGITIRPVSADEFAQRVAVHRAAWAPSTGFSLERYLQVRGITEIFDPELDLVAVDEAGRFLSCCIAWRDPVSEVGFFEPFGTHPDGRGRGISQALVYGGLQALKQKGMRHARIYTAGFNHAAIGLYQSCGFIERDRERSLIKSLQPAAEITSAN
jgi:ribosomal protein S18 acetylase RimI-like enzyme